MKKTTFGHKQLLTSQMLNERFADLAGGSILNGFRLSKGTGNYTISLRRGNDKPSTLITNDGTRLMETTDVIDAVTIKPNTGVLDRYDVLYVAWRQDVGGDITFDYTVVEGLPGQPANIETNPGNRLAIGHVCVRPDAPISHEDLTSFDIGLKFGVLYANGILINGTPMLTKSYVDMEMTKSIERIALMEDDLNNARKTYPTLDDRLDGELSQKADAISTEEALSQKTDILFVEEALEEKTNNIDFNQQGTKFDNRTRISVEEYEHLISNKNDPEELWNWSPALQGAIDFLSTAVKQGGTIVFKDNKKYLFETPVNIYKPYNFGEDGKQGATSSAHFLGTVPEIILEGGNINSTFLKMSPNNLSSIFVAAGTAEAKTYFSFSMRNIRLTGNNYQGVPIDFKSTTSPLRLTYQSVAFTHFDYGYYYDRTLGQGYTTFTNCQFGRNNNGFLVGGDNTIFINCFVQRNRNYGAIISRTNAFNFFGGKIQYNGIEQGGTQIRVSSSDNVNFWGTYLEPSTSNPPYDSNQGKALITFDSIDGPECKNFSLNGCYFNAHETRYIASVNAGTTLNGFTMQNCHFRRLKLISGGSLFYVDRGSASPASATKVRVDSSNTFTELMDSTGAATAVWRISGYDSNEGVMTNNNIVTLDQQNTGGFITKIVGSVNATGTQRLFGRGYTVVKGVTGEYTVTLNHANKGTSSGNSTFFPVIVTPQNSTNLIPSVTRTDAQTFVVRFRDLANTLVDTSFSFEATISL